MAMHQYIGARYVPKFYENSLDSTSCEWEPNVTYENMVWVSTANGHMYLSKKEVPANIGTPAQNPEYWLETGQFNGYISQLQDAVDNIDNVEIPAIDNRLDTLESNSLTEMVIIGDSYSSKAYTIDQSITPWWDYVSKSKHLTAHNYATNMMGFIYSASYPYNYDYQLDQAIADATLDNDKVALLVFEGSINDFIHESGTPNDVFTAANAAVVKARTNFPNAEIVFFMGNTFSNYPTAITISGNTYHYYDYIHEINQAAGVNGIEMICDQYFYVFDNNMFLDGYGGHPGRYGQKAMAMLFLSHGNSSPRTNVLTFADAPNLSIRRMGYNQYALIGYTSGGITYPIANPKNLDFEEGLAIVVNSTVNNNDLNQVTLKGTTLNSSSGLAFLTRSYFTVSNHSV